MFCGRTQRRWPRALLMEISHLWKGSSRKHPLCARICDDFAFCELRLFFFCVRQISLITRFLMRERHFPTQYTIRDCQLVTIYVFPNFHIVVVVFHHFTLSSRRFHRRVFRCGWRYRICGSSVLTIFGWLCLFVAQLFTAVAIAVTAHALFIILQLVVGGATTDIVVNFGRQN